MLSQGTLDHQKYGGNWCMMVTHNNFAATYYKLYVKKSDFFDNDKIDRDFQKYAKKMKRNGFGVNTFNKNRKKTYYTNMFSVVDDYKQEV